MQLGHENKETEVLIASLAVYTYLADFSGERTFPGVGDVRHATARAAQTADKLGSALAQGLTYSVVGLAHLLHDEWTEAQRWLEVSLNVVRQHHTGVASEALTLERMARGLLGAGESARARAAVEEAVALGASREQLHHKAAAQITLARILSATEGSAGRAAIETALDRARDLVEASGAGVLEAPIAEQRADLARFLGDADAYRRELNAAHRLYVAIGATGHAERVGRELA